MKNLTLKKIALVLSVFVVFSLLLVNCAGNVNAQCTGTTGGCDRDEGENMFNCPEHCLPAGVPDKLIPDVINDTITRLLELAVAISVVALIYGGTCYVFSSGDMQKTENAKKIVKYSLIGIFIAGVSFAIVKVIDTVFH
jgi:hypothetical protein